MTTVITYKHGFAANDRVAAAELYDQAFGAKFSSAIPSRPQRVTFLSRTFRPDFCFAAYRNGTLVGLAGYHDRVGSLTAGITYGSLLWQLGPIRGNWAAFIFSFYEHAPAPNVLIMGGIAVAENERGHGIGTHLLSLIIEHAATENFTAVRLDVIEGNERAKLLYEKQGFAVTKVHKFAYLRWLLGFGASFTMLKTIG